MQLKVGAGSGVEPHLLAPQRGDLRNACAAVVERQQQRVVTPARPGRPVWGGKQRLDLVAAEIPDQPLVTALDGSGHHPRYLP